MELNEQRLLELLEQDRSAHKLIHDKIDDRWFVYQFDETPTQVTSVPKDLAIMALQQHWVAEHEDDRRAELPHESHDVFLLTDAGAQELTRRR